MTNLEEPHASWEAWVAQACAALDVDPALVDITAIHELTKRVAHTVDRPLAPVSSYIVGLALGAATASGAPVTAAELSARIPTGRDDTDQAADG